jgi:hypothetical protein
MPHLYKESHQMGEGTVGYSPYVIIVFSSNKKIDTNNTNHITSFPFPFVPL